MSLKEWFRTYFVKNSFEYVINKICSISLKGQDTLPNKAELCRLKRELFYYFLQKLEETKKGKDVLDLKFGGIYYMESLTVHEELKNLDIAAIVMLQQSLKTKEVIDPMPRNQNATDLNALKESYEDTLYKDAFIECVTVIDNHIATL